MTRQLGCRHGRASAEGGRVPRQGLGGGGARDRRGCRRSRSRRLRYAGPAALGVRPGGALRPRSRAWRSPSASPCPSRESAPAASRSASSSPSPRSSCSAGRPACSSPPAGRRSRIFSAAPPAAACRLQRLDVRALGARRRARRRPDPRDSAATPRRAGRARGFIYYWVVNLILISAVLAPTRAARSPRSRGRTSRRRPRRSRSWRRRRSRSSSSGSGAALSIALVGPLLAIALYQRSTFKAIQAMRLALTDPLTGLGNHRQLPRAAAARARRGRAARDVASRSASSTSTT